MIEHNLSMLREQIGEAATASGRDPASVRLIAVSKTRPVTDVAAALAAGQQDFGENILQDALPKIEAADTRGACWHFIGHLQSKKAKQFAGRFDWLHSVDSERLVERLARALRAGDAPVLNALIQVNIAAEASKSGVKPGELGDFLERVMALAGGRIRWRGLMTIGVQNDSRATRQVFAECRGLAGRVREKYGLADFDQLSMGMSGDYVEAIAEGATMVRIGTAIFGERDTKK